MIRYYWRDTCYHNVSGIVAGVLESLPNSRVDFTQRSMVVTLSNGTNLVFKRQFDLRGNSVISDLASIGE